MVKWVLVLSAGFSAAGCFSTTEVSTVGPFVHAVYGGGPQLLLQTCDINHVKTTDYDFITPILVPHTSAVKIRTELTETDCITSPLRTRAEP